MVKKYPHFPRADAVKKFFSCRHAMEGKITAVANILRHQTVDYFLSLSVSLSSSPFQIKIALKHQQRGAGKWRERVGVVINFMTIMQEHTRLSVFPLSPFFYSLPSFSRVCVCFVIYLTCGDFRRGFSGPRKQNYPRRKSLGKS